MARHLAVAIAALGLLGVIASSGSGADFVDAQFRLTHHGADGANAVRAAYPATAHNSRNDTYLVAFVGDGTPDRVFVQVFDGAGNPIGAENPINDNATAPISVSDNTPPSVAYDGANDQYLVTWTNSADTTVWAQRVDANGSELGGDIQVSETTFTDIETTPVAFNPRNEEFLVVWKGTPAAGQHVYGQRITASTGAPVGANDFQISQDGTGNADNAVDVVYNTPAARYLVVWSARQTAAGEFEIYGQLLSNTGAATGPNDFRISDMGPDANTNFSANPPSVVYNSSRDEFLVLWSGDDDTGALVSGEFEVYAQRVDRSGAEVGTNDVRVSQMGADGNSNFDAFRPSGVWNPTASRYEVTWHGDDSTDEKFEVFAQQLDASLAPVGGESQVSTTSTPADTGYDSNRPQALWRPATCESLVVWNVGDLKNGTTTSGEWEAWARYVDAPDCPPPPTAAPFRMTQHGADGDEDTRAAFHGAAYNSRDDQFLVVFAGDGTPDQVFIQRFDSAGSPIGGALPINENATAPVDADDFNPVFAAYNSRDNEYLVTWTHTNDQSVWAQRIAADGSELGGDIQVSDTNYNDIETAPVAYNPNDNEYFVAWKGTPAAGQHVWGQRIAADGTPQGGDFQISQDGTGNANDAIDIAFNPQTSQYLVVWRATQAAGSDFDIYGQLVSAAGAEAGPNDFRISDMGPNGNTAFQANPPTVAYNSTANEFLVGWSGDDDTAPLVNNEFEVHVQRIGADGSELGTNDIRISDTGPTGVTVLGTFRPSIVWNPVAAEYLVAWHADRLIDTKFEIIGQKLSADGSQIGDDDFPLSSTSPRDAVNRTATRPEILLRAPGCGYLATFLVGDPFYDTTGFGEWEVFGARIGECPPPPPTDTGPTPTPSGQPALLPGACANLKSGTAAADTLVGTNAGDRLNGLGGNDVISGLLGADCLNGGTGRDRLSGGGGNDRLRGNAGNDRGAGGAGNDNLGGDAGADRLAGDSGNDRVSGGAGNDTLGGGRGRDTVSGGNGNDTLSGGAGNDRITTGKGKNRVSAGAGNDNVTSANKKRDVVNCGSGRKDRVRADRIDRLRGCERVRRV